MLESQVEVANLTDKSEEEQKDAGYFHTLREILQQPKTWLSAGEQMLADSSGLLQFLGNIQAIVLTGSGSSEYAGECVRVVLQHELSIATQTIGGGVLLTEAGKALAPGRPCLMISLARSGDSPESAGVLSLMLETEPGVKHLVITCNSEGKLAGTYKDNPRVKVVVLDERTNDRSLVMTSSFTTMVLAARSLGLLSQPRQYRELTHELSRAADDLLRTNVDTISSVARRGFQRVLFLASGSRIGAARESALKMLEMTAGRVTSMSETYLGLRHGPMSAVHPDTLIVCFLSSGSPRRAYECDVVRELNRKQLGLAKLIFGDDVPPDLAERGDVVIECGALSKVGDDSAPILDAVVGQLLAFFRCLKEGLSPDHPSKSGVINRVVEDFELHVPKD
jgi:tagatose-6-phosphate ketose/aldose isomerase